MQIGDVVLVEFPFSEGAATKLRPALVLCESSFLDVVLCQITTNNNDSHSIVLAPADVVGGKLARDSFIKPLKIMTVTKAKVQATIGRVTETKYSEVIHAIQRAARY